MNYLSVEGLSKTFGEKQLFSDLGFGLEKGEKAALVAKNGAGKTTLLKEIIAGNLVERANLLAQYTDPDDAFVLRQFQDGDKMHGGYSQYCWGYYDFADDRLKDYGMLVASCNNAAVENITKELPDGAALLKGVEPGKEEESIQEGLREVWSLFRLEEAEQETYVVWNPEKEKNGAPPVSGSLLYQAGERFGQERRRAVGSLGIDFRTVWKIKQSERICPLCFKAIPHRKVGAILPEVI